MRLDFSNIQQITTFLLSIALGAAFALIYDIIRVLMSSYKYGGMAVFFADVTFFAAAGVVTFVFFVLLSKGTIRFYVLLGEGIGFFTFRILFSKLVRATLKFISRTINNLLKLVMKPLLRLVRIFLNIFVKLIKFLRKSSSELQKLSVEYFHKAFNFFRNSAKKQGKKADKTKKLQKK